MSLNIPFFCRARCPLDIKACQALDEHLRMVLSTKTTTASERLSVTDLCTLRDGWLAGPGAGIPTLNTPTDFQASRNARAGDRFRSLSPSSAASGKAGQPRKRAKSESDSRTSGPVTCNRFNKGLCHSTSGSTRCPRHDQRDHLCDAFDQDLGQTCLKPHPAFQHAVNNVAQIPQLSSSKAAKK